MGRYPSRPPVLSRTVARRVGIRNNTVLGGGGIVVDPIESAFSGTFSVAADDTDLSVTFTARDASGNPVEGYTPDLTVDVGDLSAALSSVALSASVIQNNGTDTAVLTVTLRDTTNQPMRGIPAANITLGGTTNLTVTAIGSATDANGAITYSVVSSTGGSYTITATFNGLLVTDTASLEVLGSLTPNLPAGLTEYGTTNFGDILDGQVFNAAGFTVSGGQNGVTDGQLRTDVNQTASDAPAGDTNVYAYTYPGNSAGNGVGVVNTNGTGELSLLFSDPTGIAARRVYASFYVWFSPNYVTHTSSEKLFYPFREGAFAPALNVAIAPGDDAYGEMCFNFQPQSVVGPQNVSQTTGPFLTKGVWHLVEVEMRMNTTSNTTDGELRVWLDGDLVWERTDLNYGGSLATPSLATFRIDGTRGGGASSVLTPPEGQTRRFAYLSVHYSTTR